MTALVANSTTLLLAIPTQRLFFSAIYVDLIKGFLRAKIILKKWPPSLGTNTVMSHMYMPRSEKPAYLQSG